MMKRIKALSVFVVAFLLSAFAFLTVRLVGVKAETPSNIEISMEKGASVKTTADGIRFRVQMNESAYDYIVTNDTQNDVTLKVYIAPREFFDAVRNGSSWAFEALAVKAVVNFTDEGKIYKQGDLYYANAVMTALAEKGYQGVDFVGVGVVTDNNAGTFYAEFAEGDVSLNTRSQYYVLNKAYLDPCEDYADDLAGSESPYAWYGSESYPIRVQSYEELKKLATAIDGAHGFSKCVEVEPALISRLESDGNYSSALEIIKENVKKFDLIMNEVEGVSFDKTILENIPYGSVISVADNVLTVNGVEVTATVEEGKLFAGWGIENGTTVTDDITVTVEVTDSASYLNVNVLDVNSVSMATGWDDVVITPSVEDGVSVADVPLAYTVGPNLGVAFKTNVPDEALRYFADLCYVLKVSFVAYYHDGGNCWDGDPFLVAGVTSSNGEIVSIANTDNRKQIAGSQTLVQELDIDLNEYLNAMEKVDAEGVGTNAYSFAISRTTQNSPYYLKIRSVAIFKSATSDESEDYLNRNVLDVKSVAMKSNWNTVITPVVEEGISVADVPKYSLVGNHLAVAFKTIVPDELLRDFAEQNYVLRVSFAAYYHDGANCWNGDPFLVAGVTSSDGEIVSITDTNSGTQIVGSQTSVHELDINLNEYLNAMEKVDEEGIGASAYSFAISRTTQNSPYYLKIHGAQIVKLETPAWGIGSIAAATGERTESTTRLYYRDYIEITDGFEAYVGDSYEFKWFAYDGDKQFLGTHDDPKWWGSGKSFTDGDVLDAYPTAKYLRVIFRKTDDGQMSLSDVDDSSVLLLGIPNAENRIFSYSGEKITIGQSVLSSNLFTVSETSYLRGAQDGAVYDNYIFLFDKFGKGTVHNATDYTQIASFVLDKKDVICPHSNSVCFGTTYYDETDEFPLLYANVYNNYAGQSDTKLGYCLVYRIQRDGTQFTSTLVQVIKIGFVDDATYWYAEGETRPYGNFVIDTDEQKLYAFVMRQDKTSFMEFDVPSLSAGVYDDTYGVNVVTLTVEDVVDYFDCEYFACVQGVTYYEGKIYSLEGFGGDSNDAVLRVVDLTKKQVVSIINLSQCGCDDEPEMVYVKEGKLYVNFIAIGLFELKFY